MFTPTAVLITGGFRAVKSAEIYHPDLDSPCVLPDLPWSRRRHTQGGSLVCAGIWASKSCRKWNPDTGAWDLVTLKEQRTDHTSWTPAEGSVTYLMGGYVDGTGNTSEILQHKNRKVSASFPLKYNSR